ncbi:nucleoside diphosphate hydrolase, putative [Hepatocystis sp. ex Piliocolobus tephrosceles]|nr:nucleoside diphosphate hydrolase, putative [Hepatocystis sp. ex Piliocolobus tephrosceles]
MTDIIQKDFENNKNERIIIVNDKDEYERIDIRKNMRLNNWWHRTTLIFVFTLISNEYFLYVHKRSKLKDYCPSYYSLGFGGIISENENYVQNAIKELQEESGITKNEEQLYELGLYKCDVKCTKCFIMAYVTFISPYFQLIPQPSEVDFIEKIPLKDLDQFIQKEKVTMTSLMVFNNLKNKLTKEALDEYSKIIN